MSDLEVVWNGAHHGDSRDLLCVSTQPTTVTYRPIVVEEEDVEWTRYLALKAQVAAALELRERWSLRELARFIDGDRKKVTSLVQRWKRHGILTSYSRGQFGLTRRRVA